VCDQVCTEHILLGLVTEATGKGGRQADRSCLAAIKLEAARAEVRLCTATAHRRAGVTYSNMTNGARVSMAQHVRRDVVRQ